MVQPTAPYPPSAQIGGNDSFVQIEIEENKASSHLPLLSVFIHSVFLSLPVHFLLCSLNLFDKVRLSFYLHLLSASRFPSLLFLLSLSLIFTIIVQALLPLCLFYSFSMPCFARSASLPKINLSFLCSFSASLSTFTSFSRHS